VNLHPGISQLISADQHLYEGRELRADAQKIWRCHDAVEFRDENAVSPAVVSDENVPVPEIFLCGVGNVVGVDVVRHFRRLVVDAHAIPRTVFVTHGEHCTDSFSTQSDSTEGSKNRHNTSPCGCIASVPPAIVHESVITLPIFLIALVESSPDAIAPTVERCPRFPATVGADNSRRLS